MHIDLRQPVELLHTWLCTASVNATYAVYEEITFSRCDRTYRGQNDGQIGLVWAVCMTEL